MIAASRDAWIEADTTSEFWRPLGPFDQVSAAMLEVIGRMFEAISREGLHGERLPNTHNFTAVF
jgi:hypothetical protein